MRWLVGLIKVGFIKSESSSAALGEPASESRLRAEGRASRRRRTTSTTNSATSTSATKTAMIIPATLPAAMDDESLLGAGVGSPPLPIVVSPPLGEPPPHEGCRLAGRPGPSTVKPYSHSPRKSSTALGSEKPSWVMVLPGKMDTTV